MAEEGTPTQVAEAPSEGQEPSEIGRLLEGFESFKSDIGSRVDRIEQLARPPDDGAEEDPAAEELPEMEYQAELAPDDFDEQGQLTPEAAQRQLELLIDQRAAQIADARVAPIHEERASERRASEADQLEGKYPELRDEKVQQEMIDKSISAARQMGRPELGVEPRFLEMVYLAEKAGERADQETPAGADREVHLESGSPATAAENEDPDVGDRIVALAQRRGLFR